ncbi:MAG: hypothetical protein WC554_17825 [Clostridia bacterium]
MEPKVGLKIYVPGAMYVYRGEDDFAGGIATISKVDKENNIIMISIEERPGTRYNWKYLLEDQDKLKTQFGDQIAHPDPDYRAEFNQPDADWH